MPIPDKPLSTTIPQERKSLREEDQLLTTSDRLRTDALATDSAVIALGLLAVKQLMEKGAALFYIEGDHVCLAASNMPLLDALPESQAIQQLVALGFDDEQLTSYLEGRDSRKSHSNKEDSS